MTVGKGVCAKRGLWDDATNDGTGAVPKRDRDVPDVKVIGVW